MTGKAFASDRYEICLTPAGNGTGVSVGWTSENSDDGWDH
jgi:hypothetical protein